MLPERIEVWCCPSKHDKRTELYLDGGIVDKEKQVLGFLYRRVSNGDDYTPVLPKEEMLEWINNPYNDAEPEAL